MDIFNESKADELPEHQPYDLKIQLEPGATPPLRPIYFLSKGSYLCRTPLVELWSFLFKKKDRSLRLCMDYRGLNTIIRKDRYPTPLVLDLLDTPQKAWMYTKIDLRHAYNLTFQAPAAFQQFVNDIFSDLLDVCIVIYLDNILIYSNNPEQYHEHVKEVLQQLQKNKLFVQADKCKFRTNFVKYLRYILSPDRLTKLLQDCIPLTRLTRKSMLWDFNEDCQRAFNTLKKAFTTARYSITRNWTILSLLKLTPLTTLLPEFCLLPPTPVNPFL
ncbi:hypothetical protein ACG7TL_008822 [Trametes sanguinea]